MKMEQTMSSKTLAYKIQTLGNFAEKSIKHSEQGECLKSRKILSRVETRVVYRMVPWAAVWLACPLARPCMHI
jgi:hypothetical protein